MSHPGGRPLKFKSVGELQSKVDAYFEACDNSRSKVLLKDGSEVTVKRAKPYTITGLALALDTTRETLLDYEKGKYDNGDAIEEFDPQYSDTIKKAKLKCQNYAEEYLYSGSQATGAIFNLKNNYGWKDKTETDITTKGEAINEIDPAKAANYAEYLKNRK